MLTIVKHLTGVARNPFVTGFLLICILALFALMVANIAPAEATKIPSGLPHSDGSAQQGSGLQSGQTIDQQSKAQRTAIGQSRQAGTLGAGTQDNDKPVRNSTAPYIVDDGVQMFEITNSFDASGWSYRTIGDDTYGNAELIVVSVEFNTEVIVNGAATFRIEIGETTKNLVPVATRDNAWLFANFAWSADSDTDGIRIGDNTETLGHNPADYFQSVPTSDDEQAVNAVLTHASLGTLSDHKVKGSQHRPKITNINISSTPQYDDTYVRGETIKIKATFNKPVVVRGDVFVTIQTKSLGSRSYRHADYAEGSGTSNLIFEYQVGFLDIDPEGIAIPSNALAQNRDIFAGLNGTGKISGRSGGLIPNLKSNGRGSNTNHKVDTRLVALPDVIASAQWDWEQNSPDSNELVVDFSITEDPGHFSEDISLVMVPVLGNVNFERFVFGLRTDLDKPGTGGAQGKGSIFNLWPRQGSDATAGSHARIPTDGWVENGQLGGPFISIRKEYNWTEGNYSARIAQDGDDDSDGRWFGLWITNKSTGVETHLGSLKFDFSEVRETRIQTRSDVFGSIIAIVGQGPINFADIPLLEMALALPEASGGDLPNAATVAYSLFTGAIQNSDVSFDEDIGKLIMRVGGSTTHSTSQGTTLTGLEPRPLTASFSNTPEEHHGISPFSLNLTFSEDIAISYVTMRDDVFTVTGGSIKAARRVTKGSNVAWELEIRPSGHHEDIVITLPTPQYCGATGAICTSDGRELEETVAVTIPFS
jgi:hypothetical protein